MTIFNFNPPVNETPNTAMSYCWVVFDESVKATTRVSSKTEYRNFWNSICTWPSIRCIHQLAEGRWEGANSKKEPIILRKDPKSILSKEGLMIRQWASNDSSVLKNIPQDDLNIQLQLDIKNIVYR